MTANSTNLEQAGRQAAASTLQFWPLLWYDTRRYEAASALLKIQRGRHAVLDRSNSHPARRLFRLKEAAEYLSCSDWLIRQFVHQGKLPYIQYAPDGPWWFDVADLDKFVEQNKHTFN